MKNEQQWKKEFPSTYNVPGAVDELVGRGFLSDESWHNDVCPRFEIKTPGVDMVERDPSDIDGLWLWVDATLPEDREFYGGPDDEDVCKRYRIERVSGVGRDFYFLLETEDLAELLVYLLAIRFSDELMDGVTEEQLEKVNGNPADLCDSNMVMHSAYSFIYGVPPVLPCDVHDGTATEQEENESINRWNRACEITEKNGFFLHVQPPKKDTNCLDGMSCPKCGYRDRFAIDVCVTVLVEASGPVDKTPDIEWDNSDYCRCGRCEHDGTVAEFYNPEQGDNDE